MFSLKREAYCIRENESEHESNFLCVQKFNYFWVEKIRLYCTT